ncbi:XdhC family protein [Spongiivirga sp. MCCC 1A20706]|uniref:XdhC family protein n=1 Tax=Spongiivirga sp. MCCC 1A20706 TaxID=3160963 RepID=UPI0039772ABD
MKEIKSILSLYKSHKEQDEKCAIAQVVRVEESSYRREGARMLVYESGVFEGGISGGCLEGDALKRSQIAILKDKPSIVTYDTSKDDENEIGVGLGCNGVIDVLISPINQKNSALYALEKCISARRTHIIVTITAHNHQRSNVILGGTFYYNTDTKLLENCDDPELEKKVVADVETVLSTKKSRIYHYDYDEQQVSVFIEYVPAPFHLAIFGDNYDVYPMIDLASVLDWEISLTGNLQKLKKDRLHTVARLFTKEDNPWTNIDNRTAIILMAHDYKTDLNNLKKAVKTSAPYIACLGPKKRFDKMRKELLETGEDLNASDFSRIYAPCGLEIGANTPEEIATSIFAEVLTVFSGKKGGLLREKKGPIHERN